MLYIFNRQLRSGFKVISQLRSDRKFSWFGQLYCPSIYRVVFYQVIRHVLFIKLNKRKRWFSAIQLCEIKIEYSVCDFESPPTKITGTRACKPVNPHPGMSIKTSTESAGLSVDKWLMHQNPLGELLYENYRPRWSSYLLGDKICGLVPRQAKNDALRRSKLSYIAWFGGLTTHSSFSSEIYTVRIFVRKTCRIFTCYVSICIVRLKQIGITATNFEWDSQW